MVRKIDYLKHVLNSICTYMPWNGASKREIVDDIKKKLKRRVKDNICVEVCKALSEGIKNKILEMQNGKYKLNIKTIRKRFQDAEMAAAKDCRCPQCSANGTKALSNRTQRLRSRNRAPSGVSRRESTGNGDGGRRTGSTKPRRNTNGSLTAISRTKTGKPSKEVAVTRKEYRRSSYVRKTKSLTGKVIRRIQSSKKQQSQKRQKLVIQEMTMHPKKITLALPMFENNYDIPEGNWVEDCNQNSLPLAEPADFNHRIDHSHSNECNILQRNTNIFN